jgi:hypothetical protein
MGTLTPTFGGIVPSQLQQTLANNYLSFDGAAGGNFAQQYLPELYEAEVERYGNRTLSGFLRMVGAELPMTSDQVIWSEQNRLHIAYDGCTNGGAANTITIPIAIGANPVENVISPQQTIVVLDDFGAESKCLVITSDTATGVLEVLPYGSADLVTEGLVGDLKIFVYGSEYPKGTNTTIAGTGTLQKSGNDYPIMSVTPSFKQFSNKPVIIRNSYSINGSDTAQIGWVEVATEDGTSGYLWYLKAESETRLRFEDYLEMAVVEGEQVGATSTITGVTGTEGLFAAIEGRGNKMVGFSAATNGIGDFDDILRNLDTQGAIEENMLFLNRNTNLEFDDMLAGLSSGAEGGTAYGLFENSAEMALNLGFTGFRRGSYDFYKTDWKYLNDASTRGAQTGPASVEGVLVPAGTSTVYDQILGTNIRRPFLHVRYRASQADDRRMKSWLTGSVGGAFTSDLDAMTVNFLSERCLVVQAANNFVIFKGA